MGFLKEDLKFNLGGIQSRFWSVVNLEMTLTRFNRQFSYSIIKIVLSGLLVHQGRFIGKTNSWAVLDVMLEGFLTKPTGLVIGTRIDVLSPIIIRPLERLKNRPFIIS